MHQGDSSQDEVCDDVVECIEEYKGMESSQGEGCDDMLVRDDVSVLDELFWNWITKCEMRADPVSVALLSSMSVALLKNVDDKPVPC